MADNNLLNIVINSYKKQPYFKVQVSKIMTTVTLYVRQNLNKSKNTTSSIEPNKPISTMKSHFKVVQVKYKLCSKVVFEMFAKPMVFELSRNCSIFFQHNQFGSKQIHLSEHILMADYSLFT